jgi:hypothetical protein
MNEASTSPSAGCPSELTLLRLHHGELSGAAADGPRHHLAGCGDCARLLRELTAPPPPLDHIELWRRAHPPSGVRRLVEALSWQGPIGLMVGAAAVAVLVMVARPGPATVTKGGPFTLSLVVARSDGQIERIDPGAPLQAGDRLRFEVSTTWPHAQVALVSLDGRGAVTPLVPARGELAPVTGGRRVLLDGAVELDDAVGPERILLVGCPRALPVIAVAEAARAALSRAGGDPRRVGRLGLGCEETSFWINKVPR